jgi:hypothetical protein
MRDTAHTVPTVYDHRWDPLRLIELGGACPCCKATLRLRDEEAQQALEARRQEMGRSTAA